jgi:hypothetical protein
LEDSSIVDTIQGLLMDEETHAISEAPILVKVSDALHLWRLRLATTVITGRPIHGAESLIERLRAMPKDHSLEQIGFIGPRKAGNLFFDADGGEFIGFVIVDRMNHHAISPER